MAFISISITKNHPLILGKGGFGRQLARPSVPGWRRTGKDHRCAGARWFFRLRGRPA